MLLGLLQSDRLNDEVDGRIDGLSSVELLSCGDGLESDVGLEIWGSKETISVSKTKKKNTLVVAT